MSINTLHQYPRLVSRSTPQLIIGWHLINIQLIVGQMSTDSYCMHQLKVSGHLTDCQLRFWWSVNLSVNGVSRTNQMFIKSIGQGYRLTLNHGCPYYTRSKLSGKSTSQGNSLFVWWKFVITSHSLTLQLKPKVRKTAWKKPSGLMRFLFIWAWFMSRFTLTAVIINHAEIFLKSW